MERTIINNKKVQENLVLYTVRAAQMMSSGWSVRSQLQLNDLAYMRERNYGLENQRAKIANTYGDKSRIQDITVPIVMPQIESGVAYLSSVFLTGYPLFGVTGDKNTIDEAMQMDTLMAEHSVRGGWVRELNMIFRDGLKHNIAALEVDWKRDTVYQATTDAKFSLKEARPEKTIWEGNKLKRLDLYNTFWDMRVAPSEVHSKGEFAGYHERLGRVAFRQFMLDLTEKTNALEALKTVGSKTFYFEPLLNPDALIKTNNNGKGADWSSFLAPSDGVEDTYANSFEVTTIYAKIVPSEFDLVVPERNTPQVWKLIVVNGDVLLFAERQTNMHNFLPILICQPLEDGLKYQTKSFGQNVTPMQEVSSAMLNASLHAKRRTVFDRLLYDPSRIRKEDINSANPVARIPVRPSAYGKPLGEAVYAFPFRDDASGMAMQEIGMLKNMADSMQGINQAQQGQFVKGNKTQHEYADVMTHSNARLQTMAMFLEAQFFTPLKEILKLNIMQFAQAQTLYNRNAKQQVTVDPVALRQAALAFKVSDGVLPSDKLIGADTFQTVIQMFMSVPDMQMEFDITGFLVYYLKSQGAKDIEEFRLTDQQKQQKQQQMLAQQQASAMAQSSGQAVGQHHAPKPPAPAAG